MTEEVLLFVEDQEWPNVPEFLGDRRKDWSGRCPGLLWLQLSDFYEVPPAGDRVILMPDSDASHCRPSHRAQVCSIL